MSAGKKSLSRDSNKKATERISEDFYARMESDVKSLVKKMRPGSTTADSEANESGSSLFRSATKLEDMKDKKRKRMDNSAATNRSNDQEGEEEEQDGPKNVKKAKSSSSTPFSANPAPRSSSSTQPSKPQTTASSSASENITSHHYANEKTVYVSGLPFSCTEEDIRTFFKDIGTIKSVRLPRWHDSGKLRGYGHVEFSTKAAADAAMELSGQYIGDRFVNVDRPMVPRAAQNLPVTASTSTDSAAAPAVAKPHPPGCRTIFIKNLPYDVTEDEIRQHFMVYGPIMNIRLAGWNHTNNLKGFGYVEYKREDSTEIAVKKNGTIVIRDRRIVVDYDTAAPKGSYRNPTKDPKKK